MEMTPLALVVLLGFGLLIAICLTAWTAVSYDPTGSQPESTQRPLGRSDEERQNVRPGIRRQRSDDPRRSDAVRAGRGSRQPAAGASGIEGARGGSSKASQSEISGGAWRSAGGATVTARRVAPERAVESGPEAAGKGGRGGGPKQTRGARAGDREPKQEHDEDAFERFLRARPDDIDIG